MGDRSEFSGSVMGLFCPNGFAAAAGAARHQQEDGRPKKVSQPVTHTPPTLADLGIQRKQAHRWQSIATIPGAAVRSPFGAWLEGWTQAEIGERLGVARSVISEDVGNCHLAKIDKTLGEHWNAQNEAL